ncbi:photosystem I assembly protein Ycf3 [Caballeronia calidae]|uniref:Photosystem I assembly protein Ycf3 n=1 Tax=Caballeronia calidae TaxID=1777139 RepID=A0A158EK39_9BURK|nr:photosystem I assembly protein Ycf3 [Caballeronia calidae]
MTCGKMAEVFEQAGQHAKAVESLECALRYFVRVNATGEIGTALNNMAVSYRELGAVDEARRCYERSLEIRRHAGDFGGLAATLHNLAVLHADRSDYDRARLLLEEARELRREMGDNQGLGRTVLRMGMLHEAQGDNSSAIECYEHALKLAEAEAGVQSRADEATALLNLADAWSNQGEIELSLALIDKAEKLFDDTEMMAGIAMTHYGRARTLAAAGRPTQALACFEIARSHFAELGDRPRLINTGLAIGNILSRRRQHEAARDAFVSVLQLQRQLSLPRDEVITLQLISRECAAAGDAPAARNAAQASADLHREVVAHSESHRPARRYIVDAAAGDGSAPDADEADEARYPTGPCSLH